MKVAVLVTRSCLTGSSVHRISQARILELVAIPFSKGPFWLRDWTWISCIAGRFFTIWASREAPHINISCTISFSSVQLSYSVVSDSLRPHGLQHSRPHCPSPTPGVYPNSCPMSRWCHPTISSSAVPFSSCPQSFPTSRVFSDESVLRIRWPRYWSFSFSISSSNEHPGLISFRTDWLDLLAVQGTLKSLLQHHSSKASILQHSAFFTGYLIYFLYSISFFTISLTDHNLCSALQVKHDVWWISRAKFCNYKYTQLSQLFFTAVLHTRLDYLRSAIISTCYSFPLCFSAP